MRQRLIIPPALLNNVIFLLVYMRRFPAIALMVPLLVIEAPAVALAVPLPGAANSARILPKPVINPNPLAAGPEIPIRVPNTQAPPEAAKGVRFTLKGVVIEGADGLGESALRDLYADSLGRTVTLDMAWVLAAQITDRYKQAGYFLTRAYVPEQTIEDGILHIRVAEGFIESVTLDKKAADSRLVTAWIARLKSYKPINTRQLEQALLELNALSAYQFQAVLTPPKSKAGAEGATNLDLVATHKAPRGAVRFDNLGSRYLGPYRVQTDYELWALPDQKTSLSLLSSLPTKEVKSISLRHAITLAPQWSIDLGGYYTTSAPGYRLAAQDVKSETYVLGAGATYQWVRQRTENLSTRLGFDWINTQSDILGTPLVRDRIRRVQANLAYDRIDSWAGYNSINATVTQGIDGLGSNEAGQGNPSRRQAKPDFTKFEITASRLQNIDYNVQAFASFNGQLASGALYSSEEFGFGGQGFGRAYDSSEITGDHGASAALELRYAGITPFVGITPTPFVFYDTGVVFNEDSGQPAKASASSAGFGVRAQSDIGLQAGFTVAFPLTRDVADPLYSRNGKAPRLLAELSYEF